MKGQDGTGCKFTVACSKLVQISGMTASPRTVCDARRLKLRRGDILIAGTDGLFDNIGDSLSLNHSALAVAFASSTQSSADMRPCGRIWSSSPWHSRTTRVRALVSRCRAVRTATSIRAHGKCCQLDTRHGRRAGASAHVLRRMKGTAGLVLLNGVAT